MNPPIHLKHPSSVCMFVCLHHHHLPHLHFTEYICIHTYTSASKVGSLLSFERLRFYVTRNHLTSSGQCLKLCRVLRLVPSEVSLWFACSQSTFQSSPPSPAAFTSIKGTHFYTIQLFPMVYRKQSVVSSLTKD